MIEESHVIPKEELEVIEIDSDSGSDIPPLPKRKRGTLKTVPKMPRPNTLPVVILVPVRDGDATMRDIASLPSALSTELQRRLHSTCDTNKTRSVRYSGLQSNPHGRLEKEGCIRSQITGNWSNKSYGGELRKSADEKCIKWRSPCAHVVVYKEQCAICFVPLPEDMRVGKAWDSFDFWVAEGGVSVP